MISKPFALHLTKTNHPLPSSFTKAIKHTFQKMIIKKGAVLDYLIRYSLKMHLTHCKLSIKAQLRLLECFVLEVTARSAGKMLEIHPNSAAFFYTKIRNIIAYHLEREAHEIFDGEIEIDESYFGARRKGKRG